MILKSVVRMFMLLMVLGCSMGCSRKEDTFVNRNWHALTTQYNTLYNGNLALEQGMEDLNWNYQDNYRDILPVEPLRTDERIIFPDSIRNQFFGIAEEKAVKAIQRHSMLIEGKERNPRIDEAYFLLGKARYFEQRFIPALEAFNYILYKYPTSNNINNALIWREKAHMRLDNDRLAIRNLNRFLEQQELDRQHYADANATLAQAYINLNFPDSALVPLERAAGATRNAGEQGRYYFILGQLYDRLGLPELAEAAFDRVIRLNRKSPRIYMINAYIEKAANFDLDQQDPGWLRDLLEKLAADRENRPFLDRIFFQTGEFYRMLDSTALAVEFYNRSLRQPVSDRFLRSVSYEVLADLYFDRSEFGKASNYYDSTLAEMSPDLREYRSIRKKRDDLSEVILYEEQLAHSDSLLFLSGLSPEDQLDHFRKYTDNLKQRALAGEFAPAMEQNPREVLSEQAGSGDPRSFYFYNEARLTRGVGDFQRIWGNRALSDNWRWGGQFSRRTVMEQETSVAGSALEQDPRFDPTTYLEGIPRDRLVLDSIRDQRKFSLYQLGLIYKEKFAAYDLAVKRLETLLDSHPEEKLELPAKYHLYQLYGLTGRESDQKAMRRDILDHHPTSRYASFIENPGSIQQDTTSPETVYNQMYRLFDSQEYEELIERTDHYIKAYGGERVLPKFEFLKARAIGRLYGIEGYKNALSHIALSYPQTAEGKLAQDLINRSAEDLTVQEFSRQEDQRNFKLLYAFPIAERKAALALRDKIEKAKKDRPYQVRTSIDVYDPATIFVVVHDLENERKARDFAQWLPQKNSNIKKESIVISSENYRIVQIQKNLDNYLSPNN